MTRSSLSKSPGQGWPAGPSSRREALLARSSRSEYMSIHRVHMWGLKAAFCFAIGGTTFAPFFSGPLFSPSKIPLSRSRRANNGVMGVYAITVHRGSDACPCVWEKLHPLFGHTWQAPVQHPLDFMPPSSPSPVIPNHRKVLPEHLPLGHLQRHGASTLPRLRRPHAAHHRPQPVRVPVPHQARYIRRGF